MKEVITDNITRLIPSRGATGDEALQKQRIEAAEKAAENIVQEVTARELAARKAAEKQALEKAKACEARINISPSADFHQRQMRAKRAIAQAETNISIIEDAEFEARRTNKTVPAILNRSDITSSRGARIMALQGTTPKEVQRLLSSLNINTNMQLSKTDTHNLLATLLTCNESQLQALMNNKKVPIAVKIIIKRLLEDIKVGAIDTVERLWDRVFGKAAPGGKAIPSTESMPPIEGLIPNTPVSREAYILIKDTIMGD